MFRLTSTLAALLTAIGAFGAANDIIAVEVKSTWADSVYSFSRLLVTVSTKGTGGTYPTRMGLSVDSVPSTGTPYITLTVQAKGNAVEMDGTVSTNIYTRTLYGTMPTKAAYPDYPALRETASGGNVILEFALSGRVFDSDIVTASILAGAYTQGGSGNNAYSGAVVNSAVEAYTAIKPTARWRKPGFQEITSSGYTEWVMAYGHFPIAGVVLTATDGTHTFTTGQKYQYVDWDFGDARPVPGYPLWIDPTALDQGAIITVNVTVYPVRGDAFTLSSDGPSPPTALFGPHKLLCNKTGAIPHVYARFATDGNDAGANTVYAAANFNGSTAYKFLTIGKALAACAAFNNANNGHNSIMFAHAVGDAGSYNWLGSSGNTFGDKPNAWGHVEPNTATGATASTVLISGASGQANPGDMIRVAVGITSPTDNTFLNIDELWWDLAPVDSPTSTFMVNVSSGTGIWYVTRCYVKQLRQGIRPLSGAVALMPALVRGNVIEMDRSIMVYHATGNYRPQWVTPQSSLFITDISGQTFPVSDNFIFDYNEILGFRLSSFDIVSFAGANSYTGFAIANNIYEASDSTGAANLVFVAASASAGSVSVRGGKYFFNTEEGGRSGRYYCIDASTVMNRTLHTVVGNLVCNWGIKGSTFVGAENANNVGNMDAIYGIGWSHNDDWEAANTGGANGAFPCEWFGLYSRQVVNGNSPTTYPGWADRAAYGNGIPGRGGGVYVPRENSQLRRGLTQDAIALSPIDQRGRYRTTSDFSGAVARAWQGDPRSNGRGGRAGR